MYAYMDWSILKCIKLYIYIHIQHQRQDLIIEADSSLCHLPPGFHSRGEGGEYIQGAIPGVYIHGFIRERGYIQ